MDDFGGNDGESDTQLIVVAVVHIVVIALMGWCACRCCCPGRCGTKRRDADTEAEPAATEFSPDQLQPKKRLLTAYFLWLVGGYVGVHHFYLDRLTHGLAAGWTVNFLLCGWFLDALLLPYYVRDFNARRTAPGAPYDSSCRRLMCRLPALMLVALGFCVVILMFLPTLVHKLGLVDIDRLAAQTTKNPYDVLGIPYSSDMKTAKKAYHVASMQWHPDKNEPGCKECEEKMTEITKAFDLIKKRKAPAPVDYTWKQWSEDLLADWKVLADVIGSQARGDDASERPPPRQPPHPDKRASSSEL